MAYIQTTQDEDQTVGNVGTNLFQNVMGVNNQQQQNPNQVGNEDTSQQIQAGGGSSVPAAQGSPAQQSEGKSAGAVAIARNKGRQTAPVDLKGVAGTVRDNTSRYQQEADDYFTNTQNAQNWSVGDTGALKYQTNQPQGKDDSSLIESALSGDDNAAGKVRTAMSGAYEGTSFKPETNMDHSRTFNAASDAGIERTFLQRGGPMATQGEAEFDRMLLNQDAGFQADRSDFNRAKRDVSRVQDETSQRLGSEDYLRNVDLAREQAAGRYGTAVRTELEKINAAAKSAAAADQARRQAEVNKYLGADGRVTALPPDVLAEINKVLPSLVKSQAKGDASVENQLSATLNKILTGDTQNFAGLPTVNYGDLFDINTQYIDPSAYYSDSDLLRGNRAIELLGLGGAPLSRNAAAPASAYSTTPKIEALKKLIQSIPVAVGAGREVEVNKGAAPAVQSQISRSSYTPADYTTTSPAAQKVVNKVQDTLVSGANNAKKEVKKLGKRLGF